MPLFGAIGQSLFGGEASRRAATANTEASRLATRTLNQANDEASAALDPFRRIGLGASNLQAALLGLDVPGQGATGGGQLDAQAYLQANPDVLAYWQQNPDLQNQFGNIEQFAIHHADTFGRAEGREVPLTADPLESFPQLSQDDAYQKFLDSGRYKSQVALTDRNFNDITGAFASGGKLLSGSAQLALAERLKSNEGNAFNAFNNDLTNLSNQGFGAAGQISNNTVNAAGGVANIALNQGQNQANAFLQQGQNNANLFGGVFDGLSSVAGFASNGGFTKAKEDIKNAFNFGAGAKNSQIAGTF